MWLKYSLAFFINWFKYILAFTRGRGDEIHLYPLSFAEFMQVYDGDMYHGLAEYMHFGGLPFLASMQTDGQKIAYLTNLFRETYLKDIIERYHIEKIRGMEDLLHVLASSIGSLISVLKIEIDISVFDSFKYQYQFDQTVH